MPEAMRSEGGPEVSVVMSTYNSADSLEQALDSILAQEGVAFEFIVVDDGSTDGSADLLDRTAATDDRLRVVHQANTGLTRALDAGCALARGEFIARQDAGGDRSLPGRLAAQARALREDPALVAVSCAHRLVLPDGTVLCEIHRGVDEIRAGLEALGRPELRGILHPSSMFRASAFRAAGGYRAKFPVAQDLDLWLRLVERGTFGYVDLLGYDFCQELGSISSARRSEQAAFAAHAGACARARRAGESEPAFTRSDGAVPELESPATMRATYHYFIASCLRRRDPARARRHFLRAWLAKPWQPLALARALSTW